MKTPLALLIFALGLCKGLSSEQEQKGGDDQQLLLKPFGIPTNPEQVWTILGGTASLPCDIHPDDPLEQVATVLWYKGIKGEPIFTYDARGVQRAITWSAPAPRGFGGRASFDPHTKPAKLLLTNIKESEKGLYRCRVDFRKSQTRNALINVSMIIPPSPPEILDQSGAVVTDGVVGPYNEGDQMVITCVSRSGNPAPSVIWHSADGDIIDDSFSSAGESHANPENTLKINVLTKKHFGLTFHCRTRNNDVTPVVQSNVTIDMRLLPHSVDILPNSEPISVAATSAELVCRSIGSRPPAVITWWRNNKFMGKSESEVTFNVDGESVTTSRILFHPKASDHQKEVTCRAENTEIRGSAIEDKIKLNVHYPPKVILNFGRTIDPTSIIEGNDVYLECDIRAHPREYKVVWTHNGRRVHDDPDSGVRIASGGRNLVLRGVRRTMSGNYTCSAFNLEGEDTSQPTELTVMYKPECSIGGERRFSVVGIQPGFDSVIFCSMTSFPVAKRFHWQIAYNDSASGATVERALRHGTFRRLNATSSVLKFSPEGEAEITCSAENDLGRAQKPCKYKLILAGPPDPPSDCFVRNHTTHDLLVTCDPGFDGGLEQRFHLEVRMKSGDLLQNLTSHTPVFNVRGPIPSQGLSLHLYTSNARGRSVDDVFLETSPSKVAELQIETSNSGSSSAVSVSVELIGILVGLSATVVVFTIVAGLITAFRRSSHRGSSNETSGGHYQTEAVKHQETNAAKQMSSSTKTANATLAAQQQQQQQHEMTTSTPRTAFVVHTVRRDTDLSQLDFYPTNADMIPPDLTSDTAGNPATPNVYVQPNENTWYNNQRYHHHDYGHQSNAGHTPYGFKR